MKNEEVVLRVKELVVEMGLSDGKFADKIQMDRSAFSKRMSGKVAAGAGFINKIVLELGINKQWLCDGVGEKYTKTIQKDNDSDLVETLKAEINRLNVALLNKMNELSEVRDALHKYEIDELRSQIAQSEPKIRETRAS